MSVHYASFTMSAIKYFYFIKYYIKFYFFSYLKKHTPAN